MDNNNPPKVASENTLRGQILEAGTVHFAAGSFTQKHYSNGTASPIESKVQEVVEIGIDDLLTLFTAAMETVIGEDETRPTSWSNKYTLELEWRARQIRNHNRAEQRKRLAEMVGKK